MLDSTCFKLSIFEDIFWMNLKSKLPRGSKVIALEILILKFLKENDNSDSHHFQSKHSKSAIISIIKWKLPKELSLAVKTLVCLFQHSILFIIRQKKNYLELNAVLKLLKTETNRMKMENLFPKWTNFQVVSCLRRESSGLISHNTKKLFLEMKIQKPQTYVNAWRKTETDSTYEATLVSN